VPDTPPLEGTDTRKRVSELQYYFVKNDLKDDPLVFIKFEDSLKSDNKITESIAALKVWLNFDNAANAKKAKEAFEKFTTIFDEAIATFSGREG